MKGGGGGGGVWMCVVGSTWKCRIQFSGMLQRCDGVSNKRRSLRNQLYKWLDFPLGLTGNITGQMCRRGRCMCEEIYIYPRKQCYCCIYDTMIFIWHTTITTNMHSFLFHSWVPKRSDKITAIRLNGTNPPRLLSALPHHCPQLASSCKSTALLRYHFHHVHGRLYCYCAKGHTLACCCSGTPIRWYAICLTWFKCILPIIQPFCTDLSPEVPTVLAVRALLAPRKQEVWTQICRHMRHALEHTNTAVYNVRSCDSGQGNSPALTNSSRDLEVHLVSNSWEKPSFL